MSKANHVEVELVAIRNPEVKQLISRLSDVFDEFSEELGFASKHSQKVSSQCCEMNIS